MSTDQVLKIEGFSSEEMAEMGQMTSAVKLFFYEKAPKINWRQVAIFEADHLSQFAQSEKVRDFALRVKNKLSQFS